MSEITTASTQMGSKILSISLHWSEDVKEEQSGGKPGLKLGTAHCASRQRRSALSADQHRCVTRFADCVIRLAGVTFHPHLMLSKIN